MKKVLLVLVGLVLSAVLGAGAFLWLRDRQISQFSRAPFGSDEEKVVTIPPGSSPRAVSQLLAESRVVSNAELFYGLVRREKTGPKLRAGEYAFAGPHTGRQVMDKVVAGQVKLYRFTVPEGLASDDILPLIAASGLPLSEAKLRELAKDEAFLGRMGVPGRSIEGFLYPDTYAFPRSASEASVLAKMIERALEEYRRADKDRDARVRLNLMETMTLASIIEKETGAPEERPRISCVFHNRLRKGMRLQTDPTVLYAMRLIRGVFIKNITSKDLVTPHPYNTYTTAGLPPGPIASPGAAAIRAALNPLTCSDLFFVSRNDGTHIFCPDLKCHNAAVEEWQRRYFRRQAAKGRTPR